MVDPTAKCVVGPPSSSMQQCIETYGIEGKGEWVNNTLSRNAQFWSCGMISRSPSTPSHDHDPLELERCRTLATEAASVMGAEWQMLRSGSDPETQPFYIAAQRDATIPTRVSEALIREALGGTLHPDASVLIEPLTEGTKWWREIEEDAREMIAESTNQSNFNEFVRRWRQLISWFSANELTDPSFVRTTDSAKPCSSLGCVFPCFVVGISSQGSLIGISTHVVE